MQYYLFSSLYPLLYLFSALNLKMWYNQIHKPELERIKNMLEPKIKNKLENANIQYEILHQEKPILSASDAEGYYPVEKAAPTFILQTENGLIGCLTSFQNGRLDFDKLKKTFGFQKLKMAEQKKIKKLTGYDVGAIPLVGLEIPCLFDKKLLQHDFVYGGTGDEFSTMKISPKDLLQMNEIIGMFE